MEGDLEARLRRSRGRHVSLLYLQPVKNPAEHESPYQATYPMGRVTDVRVENGTWKVSLQLSNTATDYQGNMVKGMHLYPRSKTEVYLRYLRINTKIGRKLLG